MTRRASSRGAVYGNALQTTITNSGSLIGTGASSVGVFLNGGGMLTNQATGLVTGAIGVSVRGAAGTVTNAGTVVGSGGTAVSMIAGFAHTLQVSRGASFSGLIDGGNTIGSSIASTLVLVSGAGAGTLTSFQNTFLNFGTVSIASGAGWTPAGDTTLAAGARLIAGSGATETGTFTNAGSISGGLAMPSGGIVKNLAGATIDGTVGVSISGGAGTITNAGSITGSGGTAVAMAAGFTNAVSLAVGGGFTGVVHAGNTAGGTISGQTGVAMTGKAGTVASAGTIVGVGGTAVSLAANFTNRVQVDSGAVFTGIVDGGNTAVSPLAVSTLELRSSASTGTISGIGTDFVNFGDVQVASGASWVMTGSNTIVAGQSLTNAGSLLLNSATLGTTMLMGAGALTIGDASVLTVNGTVAAGATIGMDGASAAFHLSAPISMAGTVTSFGLGDTITLAGIDPLSVTYSGGLLQFGSGGSFALTILPILTVQAVSDGAGGALVSAACFVDGTLIETPEGPAPVEALRTGDMVRTHDGRARRIRWVGFRQLDLARHPAPLGACPIRIRAGALADGVPVRDLRVSPEHAMYHHGGLVPARLLVNGATILRETDCRRVTYHHVELDGHDILRAEGAPSESYLDTGNRGLFENGGDPLILHPWFEDGQAGRLGRSCAPFLTAAAVVEPIWRGLARRAAALGMAVHRPAVTQDAAQRLLVDGRTLRPLMVHGDVMTFVVPAGATSIRLLSHASAPNAVRPWEEDSRLLGLSVRRIRVSETGEVRDVPLDHPDVTDGWWAVEGDGADAWRWTSGDAVLPTGTDSARIIEITAGCLDAYLEESARAVDVARAA